MTSGVYRITNTVDGKVYIGSAVNMRQRWWDHRKMLRANRHHNPYLQSAWNRDGETAFVFTPFLECALEDLIDLEQAELLRRDWNQIYNLNPTAGSRLGTKQSETAKRKISEHHRMHSEEARQAHARVMSGRTVSAETRAKMSAAKLGRTKTAEHAHHISEGKHGTVFSVEHRFKLSQVVKTDEWRRKQSAAHKGVPWSLARRAAYEMRRVV